jgi:small-conductance mechanosensitive channel
MLRIGLWSAALLAALTFWLIRIGAAPGLTTVSGLVVSLEVAVAFARTSLFLHRQIRAGLTDGKTATGWLPRNWHRIIVTYLVLAVTATALGRLSGLETSGMVIAPAAAAILASIIYAAALLAVGGVYGEAEAGGEPPLPSFRDWAERSALLVAVVVALCAVLGTWGIDFFRADGSVRPIYAILLVLLLAYIGWLAIRTAFDRRIAEETSVAGSAPEEGDEGGTGRTRLATLLPLVRNAILIAILVLVLLVMLSSMGLDIAPLFAGAGLVGIAIGFGAQTLVRDVFSGIFFLADDAFRVGEYIETGGARGTVEKISIRSMQLRHQNGPLHTIPFGEITQLTNYSRDWVIMKLPIRVRFGTDTERVRKLIKKLGQELLDHPEIGEKFVEPLKSQGVYQMDELGIVTRVKFKTKPGDQFVVRKVVYQKINELFEREGITFGGREVIVRSAEHPQSGAASLSSTDVAGAAAQAAESQQPRSK